MGTEKSMIYVVLAIVGVLTLLSLIILMEISRAIKFIGEIQNKQEEPVPVPKLTVDLSGTEARLDKKIAGIPEIVVNSITGTTNTHKGKLGELIGFLSMKAEYDRIIPLGSIVDFMAIKFPTDTEEGRVDFIDIKTGKSARLTSDQKNLKVLLDKQLLNFKTIRIDEIKLS